MRGWKLWLLIGALLVAAHGAAACYFAARFAAGQVTDGPDATLRLNMSPDDWAATICVRDSAAYLRSAQQVASGEGVTIRVPGADPPRVEPFVYWGPGAPVMFGAWMRLFGRETMLSLFLFAAAAQLLFGAMAVATVRLFTRSTVALVAAVLLSACCAPLQTVVYGINLTASETAGLIPLSIAFYVLAKAFLAYRLEPAPRWRHVWRSPAVGWFAAAGLLIGWHSLIRDSGQVFATFVALFIVARAAMFDRRRLALAGAAAAAIVLTTAAVRWPVERWNQARVGRALVSSSGDLAIWRYGLWVGPNRDGIAAYAKSCGPSLSGEQRAWLENDLYRWCVSAGFGFGAALDPAAPALVESYFAAGKPWPALFSLRKLAAAVANHPLEAAEFKLTRLPVLWLGADMWPDTRLTFVSWWCLAHYAALAGYMIVCWRRRRAPAEVLYLYPLLIGGASLLIHFEFRYTLPMWHTLVMAPGLLWALFQERGAAAATPAPVDVPRGIQQMAA